MRFQKEGSLAILAMKLKRKSFEPEERIYNGVRGEQESEIINQKIPFG